MEAMASPNIYDVSPGIPAPIKTLSLAESIFAGWHMEEEAKQKRAAKIKGINPKENLLPVVFTGSTDFATKIFKSRVAMGIRVISKEL
jgi:hypothetical protein